MTWVATVLIPVVIVPLMLTVLADWSPSLAQWIVRRASRCMPDAYQNRCAEEWQVYLADIPGGLSKLAVALGYWVRIPLLRRAVGASAFRFQLIRAIGWPLRRLDADPSFGVLLVVSLQAMATGAVITVIIDTIHAVFTGGTISSEVVVIALVTGVTAIVVTIPTVRSHKRRELERGKRESKERN